MQLRLSMRWDDLYSAYVWIWVKVDMVAQPLSLEPNIRGWIPIL